MCKKPFRGRHSREEELKGWQYWHSKQSSSGKLFCHLSELFLLANNLIFKRSHKVSLTPVHESQIQIFVTHFFLISTGFSFENKKVIEADQGTSLGKLIFPTSIFVIDESEHHKYHS